VLVANSAENLKVAVKLKKRKIGKFKPYALAMFQLQRRPYLTCEYFSLYNHKIYEHHFFNKPFSFMLKVKFRGICIYSPTLSSFEELE